MSEFDENLPVLNEQHARIQAAKRRYGFIKLIRDCATVWDKVILAVGVVLAVSTGLTFTISVVLYGSAASMFIVHDKHIRNTSSAERSTAYDSDTNQLLLRYLLLTVLRLVVAFTSLLQSMAVMVTAARVVIALRRRFLAHIVRADTATLERRRTGELNAMFHDHIERVFEALSTYGYGMILMVSGAICGVTAALYINWKQTLCAGTLMPIVAFVGVYAMKVQQEQTLFGKAATLVDETLSNIATVLAFNGQRQTLKRFNKLLASANAVSARRALIEGVANGIDIFVSDSMAGVAFLFGAFFIASYNDPASRGYFYLVAMTLLMAVKLVYTIQAPLSSIFSAKANLATVGEILQTEPEINSLSAEGEHLSTTVGQEGASIEFRNVSFFYPSRPEIKVLNNVSFTVSADEHVAIVGSSGAGKSTVANLILRFYDVISGVFWILVNGRPLSNLNIGSWRRSIGYVSQDAPMFDGTVEENIRFGKPDASRAEIMECIRKADLGKFIEEMADGYDTWVGEKGVQLSGGQRQRVAIARALIRTPTVFVFDEATSSLDSVTEQTVVAEMQKVVLGKTTVTIAHRLSTVRNADRIIVLDQGSIVEQGSHSELMKFDGKYAHMVKMQEVQQQPDSERDEWNLSNVGSLDVSSYSDTSDPEMQYNDQTRHHKDTSGHYGALRERHKSLSKSDKDVSKQSGLRTRKSMDVSADSETAEEQLDAQKTHLGQFFRMFTCGDWCKLTLSFLGSLVYSVANTLSQIASASLLVVLPLPLHQMQIGVIWISLVNIATSMVCALSRAFFAYWHNRFGDQASSRMRTLLFSTLLRHNLPFYDRPENSTGTLATILVKNPTKMRKAINLDMLLVPSIVWSFLLQTAISLYISVPFTLYCMLMVPCNIAIYSFTNLANVYFELQIQPEQEKAGKIATEIIDNLPTVQAYSLEGLLCARYEQSLKPILRGLMKQSAVSALFLAIGTSRDALYSGFIFKVGAMLIEDGQMTPVELWIVFALVRAVAEDIAQVMGQSQDVVRAVVSAAKTISIIKRPVDVDCMSNAGLTPIINGAIKLKGVTFAYPSRPDINVLCDVTANIKTAKTLAIVGPSGSGKSTIMQLLQRLYEPTEGKIELDGYHLGSINIRSLRTAVVPVNQEPVLFDGTIGENITYGLEDENLDNERLMSASRMANVHEFITSLPEGYDTEVGAKGVQLSGGQRQRIAIARALVRNPKVLLLDEATAALDTDNEQAVQLALDVARKERTCVVVAHRLSTVCNAHMILVMQDGCIVERGNHPTLLAKQGLYHELCLKQNITA